MNTSLTSSLRFWRWLFLVLETVLAATFISAAVLELGFGLSIEPSSAALEVALGLSLTLVCLFLLVATPFFFRSLRAIAVAGWIIAVVTLVVSMLLPVR